MHYPRSVYVIVPLDDDHESAAGVYVGSAYRVQERINQHLYDYCINQWELHDLMRRNGYRVLVVDTISNIHENYLEYDWIDFFKKNYEDEDFKVFNQRIGNHADWNHLKDNVWCNEFLKVVAS